MFTYCSFIKTQGELDEFKTVMQTLDTVKGLYNCGEFPIIWQMMENAIYLRLDGNRLDFLDILHSYFRPANQMHLTTPNQSKFVCCHNCLHALIESHLLTNEGAHTILIIIIIIL